MTQSLLVKWAGRSSDKLFAVFESGAAWSYSKALETSWSVGAGLTSLGLRPGEPVLSFLPNGEESVALLFGANAAGGVYAPLNIAYRGSFLEHAINVPRAAILVIQDEYLERLAGLHLPHLRTVVIVGNQGNSSDRWRVVQWRELLAAPPNPPAKSQGRKPTDDMVYIYTSGTTGPSKAVRCSYRHHEVYADWFGLGLGSDDRAFVCLPMFHVGGTGWLYTMLTRGGSIAMVPKFSTSQYWDSVRTMQATTGTIMAAMATFLLREPERPNDADNPMRIALLVPHIPGAETFARRFEIELWTGFAMSEVPGPLQTSVGTSNLKTAGAIASAAWHLKLVNDDGDEVALGEVGELVVRHELPAAITRGYVNMPEATSVAWTDGWFHTGDLFRRDEEGNYHFVDRNKDALRRRGENISSVEVEAQIGKHPAVLESAIVGVPAAEGEDDVLAFVVVKPGCRLSARELFDFLVPGMPHFMVPRYIEFLPTLPRTPTEKVMKGDLRQRGIGNDTWDRSVAGLEVTARGVQELRQSAEGFPTMRAGKAIT
jgi:crotonobetaine/carnitine-CoA ligase